MRPLADPTPRQCLDLADTTSRQCLEKVLQQTHGTFDSTHGLQGDSAFEQHNDQVPQRGIQVCSGGTVPLNLNRNLIYVNGVEY